VFQTATWVAQTFDEAVSRDGIRTGIAEEQGTGQVSGPLDAVMRCEGFLQFSLVCHSNLL